MKFSRETETPVSESTVRGLKTSYCDVLKINRQGNTTRAWSSRTASKAGKFASIKIAKIKGCPTAGDAQIAKIKHICPRLPS